MSHDTILIDGTRFAPMSRWDQGRNMKGAHTAEYNLLRSLIKRKLLADASVSGRTFVDEEAAIRLLNEAASEVITSPRPRGAMADKADAICAALHRIAVALEKLIDQEEHTAER